MKPEAHLKINLHYILLFLIVILSILRFLIWTAPNDQLHDKGLVLAIDLDLTLGFGLAFAIAVTSFFTRKLAPSKLILYVTQGLAWGQSVILFVGIMYFAAFTALNGGV